MNLSTISWPTVIAAVIAVAVVGFIMHKVR